MPSSSSSSPARVLAAPFLSAVLLLSACGSTEPETLTCETEAECPPLSRCISRGCVANSPPVAAIALPSGELQAHVLHALEGSASDPDAGDSVASFGWAFRVVEAPCDPPVVAGTGPVAAVRFACPGRYEVTLTAVDAMGAQGTKVAEVAVAPYTGPALVVAGSDVALDHACTLVPLKCGLVSLASLSAIAPGSAPGEVSFTWTVEPPPDRPLDGTRRVTFLPGAAVPAPSVSIETDGTSISGDWIFRVAGRDAAGLLGTASMRVSALNRPPVVTGTAPSSVNHVFVPGSLPWGTFSAAGEVLVSVSDPDGDPLVQRSVQFRHTGDGPNGVFDGVDQGTKLTFTVLVPYDATGDALHLIGGPGLERFVELGVSDVNGARTSATWTISVGNRPPVHAATPAPYTVDHFYDPASLSYRAIAPLSSWSDPDGDPLFAAPGSPGFDPDGDPLCSLAVSDGGFARAECALAFLGVPAVQQFTGARTVTQRVQDPFGAAAPAVQASFTIGNRPPSISSTATHQVSASCNESGACCQGPVSECTRFWASAEAGSSLVPPRWSDPDGDPLSIQVAASGAVTPVQPLVCTPATCALQLGLGIVNVCGSTSTSHSTVITDGLASASGTLTVERRCP